MTLGIALIGLGKIGFKYDLESLNKGIFRGETHTSAIMNHPHCRLVVGIDSNQQNRATFERLTRVKTLEFPLQIEDSLLDEIDAVIIATPPSSHLQVLREISFLKKRFWIMCEKPLCLNLSEVNSLLDFIDPATLIINYSRRFSKDIELCRTNFEAFLESEEKPMVNVDFYGGVLRTGSHFVDLSNFWFWDDCKLSLSEMVVDSRDSYSLNFPRITVRFRSFQSTYSESYGNFYAKTKRGVISLLRDELTQKTETVSNARKILVSQRDALEALILLARSDGESNLCSYNDAKRVHGQLSLMPRFAIK